MKKKTQPPQSAQYAPPPGYGYPAPPPAPRPPKKKGGCFGCFTGFVVAGAAVLLVAALALWWISGRDSANMTLGKASAAVTQTVPSSGGTVSITQGSMAGMKIEVPDGAYPEATKFKVSASEIKQSVFDDNFNPITPLISVENGGEMSSVPMKVTIPISISDDEFAMGFYYDRKSGELSGMPLVSLNNNQITVEATHFSDFLISKVLKNELNDIIIRTGYYPGRDDFQFINYGSSIEPEGHCAGQAMASIWYYNEKGLTSGKRLFGKFDNNGSQVKTPKFQWDDAFAYRFASVIQNKSDWDNRWLNLVLNIEDKSSRMTYYALAYSMSTTNRPQLMTIEGTDRNGNPAGHAVVAYRIEANRIYVADPNYPGKSDRYVEFNTFTSGFNPYSSGANARDIATGNPIVFTTVYYVPVGALIKWETIGREYQKVLTGEIGNDLFPDKCDIEWLSKIDEKTGEETWEKCTDEMTLSYDRTAAVSKTLAGKIKIRLTNCNDKQVTYLYLGTTYKKTAKADSSGIAEIGAVSLKKGVNDLGICIDHITGRDANGNEIDSFSNFKRIKIIYDNTDLTGDWTVKIEPTSGSLLTFMEEVVAQLIYRFKLTDSIDQARAEAKNNVAIEPGAVTSDAVFNFKKDGGSKTNSYVVTVKYKDDKGKPLTATCNTVLKQDGSLKISFWDSKTASRIVLEGFLLEDNTLGGKFDLKVFGMLNGALEGTWKLTRKP